MPPKLTRTALVGLAMAALLAGCGAAAGEPGVVVRDSAGVQIVENGPIKELPPAFLISPTPRLDLGGAKKSPDQELDPRAPFLDAARLSDGRYVVSDMSAVKVFDAKGRYVSTIGRSGDGPGEFRQLRAVCVAPGDTIIAIGYGAPRVSVFDREGHFIRTFNVKDGRVEGSGCFEDGSLLIHSPSRPNPASALPPEGAKTLDLINTARRIGSDGRVLGVVGDVPSERPSLYIEQVANTVPHGRLLYVGDGDLPEIRVYAMDGKLARIIRWEQSRIPVTDELLREQVMGHAARGTPQSAIDQRLTRVRAMPQPAAVPAYYRIQVDAAGRIWVEDHPIESAAPRPWTVFDSTGRALGHVLPPKIPGARFSEIPSVGLDEAVVAWRDEENGFAHLTFHALGRGSEARRPPQ
jgi:hypothetical protein